jgi:hypothetical protein
VFCALLEDTGGTTTAALVSDQPLLGLEDLA